jgi:hypothetical protein
MHHASHDKKDTLVFRFIFVIINGYKTVMRSSTYIVCIREENDAGSFLHRYVEFTSECD